MLKHKIYVTFFMICVSVLVGADFAHGREYGGLGTAEQPFLIYTAAEMNDIGNNYEDWDKHFLLVNDINLADYTGTQFNIIGSIATKFSGVFDGNGHTISNFTYDPPFKDFVGLFREIEGDNAEIKDLGLIDPNVKAGTGPRWWTGALVGRAGILGHCKITRCYVKGGSVRGGYDVGGLVGENYNCTISECYATCQVFGTKDEVGGLVGNNNDNGIINNCYATGSADGDFYTGGLVGASDGAISKCHATGRVTGNYYFGGLVGSAGGSTITDSFWDVNSSGQTTSAGGTGKTTAEMYTQSTFTNWDFATPVWKMVWEGTDYPKLWWEEIKYGGGEGTAEDPFRIYDPNHMQAIGADSNDWDKHFRLMANIDIGNFTGTQFNIIGNSTTKFTGVFDGNNRQISNFTYSSTGTNYIGIFGYVEGVSGEIKNLYLVDPNINAGTGDYVGTLIGKVASNSSVSNCSVENGNVLGDDYIGGLAGHNKNGTITSCYSACVVSGSDWVGGLVGRLYGGTISDCYSLSNISGTGTYGTGGLIGNIINGTVERCYSESTASGNYFVGGVVGDNVSGTIRDCYSFGSVSGTAGVGGLLGNNNESGACTRCYSATSVAGSGVTTGGLIGYSYGGPVTDSFWDVNSSGQTTSGDGTGKMTTQMMQAATFTNWDFIDIWEICEGTNYPKLAWQIPLPGDFVCPDGVETNDLGVLCEQWLLEKLSMDIVPNGGDGIVNFLDWASFASGWQNTTDMYDLAAFTDQWLQLGAYNADIDPEPAGDDIVNFLDFAIFANNWLIGTTP